MIYAPIFGLPVVVVNSIEAARELLDKRGYNYSDRARTVLYHEMYVDAFVSANHYRKEKLNLQPSLDLDGNLLSRCHMENGFGSTVALCHKS